MGRVPGDESTPHTIGIGAGDAQIPKSDVLELAIKRRADDAFEIFMKVEIIRIRPCWHR